MSHSAEFAGYLKENCLLPYNDAYTEYIDQLIKDAVSFSPKIGLP